MKLSPKQQQCSAILMITVSQQVLRPNSPFCRVYQQSFSWLSFRVLPVKKAPDSLGCCSLSSTWYSKAPQKAFLIYLPPLGKLSWVLTRADVILKDKTTPRIVKFMTVHVVLWWCQMQQDWYFAATIRALIPPHPSKPPPKTCCPSGARASAVLSWYWTSSYEECVWFSTSIEPSRSDVMTLS